MVSYKGLWKMLIDKNLKKTDLVTEVGISSATLAKMSKDQFVSMETIVKICDWLDCEISDICVVERESKRELCLR